MNSDTFSKIAFGFLIGFIVTGLVIGFNFALNAQDKADCYGWALEAQQYTGFYLTRDEADQCSYWNIPVNAPVR